MPLAFSARDVAPKNDFASWQEVPKIKVLKKMPSGTFRMEQCLQTVTILNTIALKKKKKSLTKKSKGSHFCDFFLFFVFFKKCKLASGRE